MYGEKIVYFEINGSGMKIKASTPIEHRPDNNEKIIFFGTVTLQTTPIHTGLEVFIEGMKVGRWEAQYTKAKPLVNLVRERGRYSLVTLIENNDTYPIAVVGSKKGGNDLKDGIYSTNNLDLIFSEISVGSSKEVIRDIKNILYKIEYCGLCIVRGGADETMKIWDDSTVVEFLLETNIPFYYALGHSDSITLTDQFSDESFPTPSVLGHSLHSAYLSKLEKLKQIHNNKVLEEKLLILSDEIKSAAYEKKNTVNPYLLLFIGMIVSSICTAMIIFILR
ncbi:MAG: hypothetical protein L3J59_10410 [Methylococcaceae bacterium]|nr:hypothetical protein [Methylococcaceae bacterium]